MIKYFKLGKKIFNCKRDFLAYRHVAVFTLRSMHSHNEVQELMNFFQRNSFRQDIMKTYPVIFAQLTRKLFYRNSTTAERLNFIMQTFATMEKHFSENSLNAIYFEDGLRLWQEAYKEKTMAIDLLFRPSETREGLLTLGLRLDGQYIYHINFWINVNDNKLVFGIGALQGSRDGLEINKELTKHFFGYRPKNLILYALRIVAQKLVVNEIYAVSNYGFYTNNHIRLNRKLKTSLDEFWQESGGIVGKDRRFFHIPVREHRKSIEEVVSHKRNLYRKRFIFLDSLEKEINECLTAYSK